MTSMTREMLQDLLASRVNLALDRASENPEYLEVRKNQGKAKQVVDRLYERFNKDEMTEIQRYYEDETYRARLEAKEAYLQGLRDGFKIGSFLGDFQREV